MEGEDDKIRRFTGQSVSPEKLREQRISNAIAGLLQYEKELDEQHPAWFVPVRVQNHIQNYESYETVDLKQLLLTMPHNWKNQPHRWIAVANVLENRRNSPQEHPIVESTPLTRYKAIGEIANEIIGENAAGDAFDAEREAQSLLQTHDLESLALVLEKMTEEQLQENKSMYHAYAIAFRKKLEAQKDLL